MVKHVSGFSELLGTPFANGVNALCWSRSLPGDFAAVIRRLGPGEEIETLEAERLKNLELSPPGRAAVEAMLADLRRLEDAGKDPVLNLIHAYRRDEDPGPIATDVLSWHVDSAPIETDTWLCTYAGACSEGLRAADARRKVDDPGIRGQLLKQFGGGDGPAFVQWLADHHYDLHYAPLPGAQPYSFGRFNLWRVACAWPGSPVPACVHRAPATDGPRLLLIS